MMSRSRLMAQCYSAPSHSVRCFTHSSRRHALSQSRSEWLVILPDKADASARRMQVRAYVTKPHVTKGQHFFINYIPLTSLPSTHLANIQKPHQEGFWVLGGATLNEPPCEQKPLQITGSVLIALASSREEVLEVVKRDIYAEEDVWDLEQVQILPFKTAFRDAMNSGA